MKLKSRHTLSALALAGVCSIPLACQAAALGKIEVLSNPGESFVALIPIVDGVPDDQLQLSLADVSKYPVLLPYSTSADKLIFSLQRKPDGTPLGVLVRGPASFSEARLRFAVALNWHDGGFVREFDVDYRHAGPKWQPTGLGTTLPQRVDTATAATAATVQTQPALAGIERDPRLSAYLDSLSTKPRLTLGDMQVTSPDGAPLSAQIALSGLDLKPHDKVQVKILPVNQGRAVNDDARALLASIKPSLARSASGALQLQLNAPSAINQPFRLELQTDKTKLSRVYGLDVAPQHEVGPNTPASHMAVHSQKALRVQVDDSLFAIARRFSVPKLDFEQIMHRLYADNPQAFIDGRASRLREGAVLRFPANWHYKGVLVTSARRSKGDTHKAVRRVELERHFSMKHSLPDASAMAPERVSSMPSAQAARQPKADEPAAPMKAIKESQVEPIPLQKEERSPLPAASHAWNEPGLVAGGALLAAAGVAGSMMLRRRSSSEPVGQESQQQIQQMQQALQRDPARSDIRLKLLTQLAQQGHVANFVAAAQQARPLLVGSPLWSAVQAMGQKLAPRHALFTQAELEPGFSPLPIAGAAV